MIKTRNPALVWTALLSMAVGSAACLADDFRSEMRGAYSRLIGPQDFPDLDAAWLQGLWFFAPVKSDGVPLAEAAFLARASSVSAAAARSESSFGVSVFRLNSQAANVSYYIPRTRVFAGVTASRNQHVTAVSSTIVQKAYDTRWSGTLGIAPLDGLLVTTDIPEHGYDPNISARYVGKLPNSHYYAGSVRLVDPDRGDTSFGVEFDYYFDHTFSAGVAYQDASESLTGKMRKFFTPRFSLGGSYTSDEFVDSFTVDVAWRF
jgi:Putative general bacterial porin